MHGTEWQSGVRSFIMPGLSPHLVQEFNVSTVGSCARLSIIINEGSKIKELCNSISTKGVLCFRYFKLPVIFAIFSEDGNLYSTSGLLLDCDTCCHCLKDNVVIPSSRSLWGFVNLIIKFGKLYIHVTHCVFLFLTILCIMTLNISLNTR